jgi:hypothetical protein
MLHQSPVHLPYKSAEYSAELQYLSVIKLKPQTEVTYDRRRFKTCIIILFKICD